MHRSARTIVTVLTLLLLTAPALADSSADPSPAQRTATANMALEIAAPEVEQPAADAESSEDSAFASESADESMEDNDAESMASASQASDTQTTSAPDAAEALAANPIITRNGAAATVSRATPRSESIQRESAAALPWYRTPYAALGAVLLLIVALTYAAKRFVPSARPLAADTLQVVGRVPISAKQSAVLLHVGRRVVLVGSTADHLRTLAEITDPEEVNLLLGKASASRQPAAKRFERSLAKELESYSDGADTPEPSPPADEKHAEKTQGQLRGLLDRLREMQTTNAA